MSKEHVHKFIEHLKRDPALQKKVHEASAHIVKVANDQGYEVTREEIVTAVKERWSERKKDDLDHPAIVFSEAPGFDLDQPFHLD
jgi:predicted ribosomally synthesized peptide with nif11-like leader